MAKTGLPRKRSSRSMTSAWTSAATTCRKLDTVSSSRVVCVRRDLCVSDAERKTDSLRAAWSRRRGENVNRRSVRLVFAPPPGSPAMRLARGSRNKAQRADIPHTCYLHSVRTSLRTVSFCSKALLQRTQPRRAQGPERRLDPVVNKLLAAVPVVARRVNGVVAAVQRDLLRAIQVRHVQRNNAVSHDPVAIPQEHAVGSLRVLLYGSPRRLGIAHNGRALGDERIARRSSEEMRGEEDTNVRAFVSECV
mmetsp:Transcript_18491/g.56523  ORF Transcript_18491/g.56523 Transcript_18491/m.56523 type:complete len:250 (+) Transcript_18491:1363-2112(+)